MVKNLQISSIDPSINRRATHSLVASLTKQLNFKISSLFINFVTSNDLLEINKKFLKHTYRTDVITFNYSTKEKIDGEILISIEDAFQNAKKFNVSRSEELNRLVIHGILHLLGFNDKKPKEKILMSEMEKRLIYKNKFALLRSR
ncbi:MAG: rRNA maturation RNase YbeY [Ignavibacteria bacterium]|nr:rRNA maturation RNase YbeY [Ignavibacteria bacterium]MBT8381792.1 rRNA maturation RNase YbeY [Ignavibacteria bacterium]MBT8392616.1 rRNA maturation RNase YbeY [Ignavibacteria bacterium]NNJ51625.1 rRNA maturation RNase YbeY [Ignavibacteriaceae bacterium]NNL20299.1 rRNA maturation RNase YbeY [Ignavibacteriaceae bacterium]